jgi:hypothetical protein
MVFEWRGTQTTDTAHIAMTKETGERTKRSLDNRKRKASASAEEDQEIAPGSSDAIPVLPRSGETEKGTMTVSEGNHDSKNSEAASSFDPNEEDNPTADQALEAAALDKERYRQRNAMYSRRKYQRKKIEVQVLEEQRQSLLAERERLTRTNEFLQGLLDRARHIVSLHERMTQAFNREFEAAGTDAALASAQSHHSIALPAVSTAFDANSPALSQANLLLARQLLNFQQLQQHSQSQGLLPFSSQLFGQLAGGQLLPTLASSTQQPLAVLNQTPQQQLWPNQASSRPLVASHVHAFGQQPVLSTQAGSAQLPLLLPQALPLDQDQRTAAILAAVFPSAVQQLHHQPRPFAYYPGVVPAIASPIAQAGDRLSQSGQIQDPVTVGSSQNETQSQLDQDSRLQRERDPAHEHLRHSDHSSSGPGDGR